MFQTNKQKYKKNANLPVARSRRFRIEFGIPNEIIRKYSETAWKFGLCHFLGRKKCGNLNFVIFYVGKSAESWTLLFYWQKKFGKLNFVIFIGGKSSES